MQDLEPYQRQRRGPSVPLQPQVAYAVTHAMSMSIRQRFDALLQKPRTM